RSRPTTRLAARRRTAPGFRSSRGRPTPRRSSRPARGRKQEVDSRGGPRGRPSTSFRRGRRSPRPLTHMAEPLMQAHDLAKSYGPVMALRSADVVVESGEVHALLGANGAGKSTVVKILTGVIRADRGSVAVAGKPASIRSPAEAARVGLAPVFQDPALVPDLTVSANLRLTGADPRAVRRELEAMELDVDFRQFVGDVPLPLLRMIDLARALARDPQPTRLH